MRARKEQNKFAQLYVNWHKFEETHEYVIVYVNPSWWFELILNTWMC